MDRENQQNIYFYEGRCLREQDRLSAGKLTDLEKVAMAVYRYGRDNPENILDIIGRIEGRIWGDIYRNNECRFNIHNRSMQGERPFIFSTRISIKPDTIPLLKQIGYKIKYLDKEIDKSY